MQDKTTETSEDKAPPAEDLSDEALDTVTGSGGGLPPRGPGPAPPTP